jgi:hypothetical protein
MTIGRYPIYYDRPPTQGTGDPTAGKGTAASPLSITDEAAPPRKFPSVEGSAKITPKDLRLAGLFDPATRDSGERLALASAD